MATKPRTTLQVRHERQAAIPEAFALATLSLAASDARTESQRQARARAARKVAQLLKRGEL
jgi:hypothetical protein